MAEAQEWRNYGYYDELEALDHATLRRAWIAEGRRRGYVLVDA